MFNNTVDDINTVDKSKTTKNWTRMLSIFKKLLEQESKADDKGDDKTDDKADETAAAVETDDKQPDTTDMSDLESEESAKQRITKKNKD